MSVSENLRDIILRQKAVLEELEKEAEIILKSDLAIENGELKSEVKRLRESVAKQSGRLAQLSSQNTELKNALYEQIYSERLQIISAAQKKNDAYFKAAAAGELNRLAALEKDLRGRVSRFSKEMKKYRIETTNELYEKFEALSVQATEAITAAKAKIARETGAFSSASAEQFEKLKDEQITDDVIAEIGRKNNIETFVGGNLLNKLGVLFVILGIIAVSRFTFFRLPDTFKGIIMFAVSGGFLAAGELLNRRKSNVFSLGITSAGVAGLYASLSISYFALKIIPMYPALALCVLITAVAFVLSQRYDSQTITAFALIGGYIPIISISESVILTYGAMVYFVALNLLALIISFYKKWKISIFIGFFLNLAGTLYIVFNMLDTRKDGAAFGVHELSTILYVLFAFAIYTFIPILSNYRGKRPFTKSDVVILGMNTVFSALIIYAVFEAFRLSRFNGVMALAFAVIYVGLARFIETRFAQEKHTTALFYLTGLTFVVLVIPFQFGKEWLSIGWLVQSVCLAVYGILTGERNFKKAGYVIGTLCIAAFVCFDVIQGVDNLFSYKYFAVTLGSLLILAAGAYKKSFSRVYENVYKYAALINVWFYGLYLVSLTDDFLRKSLSDTPFDSGFLLGALTVTVTFLYAFILPRIPIIASKGTKIISVCVSVFGMLVLAGVTALCPITFLPGSVPLSGYAGDISTPIPLSATIIATFILIALCTMAVYAMYSVLIFFVLEAKLPAEWLPFATSAYFLTVLTQNLISQYDLSVTSIIISIIYVVAALAWVVFGFARRFAFMRRFGLALAVLAVAKLFLVDLDDLTQGYKIISYFSFGITLLGISFVYQYFSKRLTPKGGGEVHVEETHVEETHVEETHIE